MINELQARSNTSCELCTNTENLKMHLVTPKMQEALENVAYICTTCESQIKEPETADAVSYTHLTLPTIYSV